MSEGRKDGEDAALNLESAGMEDHYGYSPEEYRRFKKLGIGYLILFSLLYCFLYCSRLNLANAASVMITDLHITRSDIGVLSGILFWTYGLGQLVSGRLGEIFGSSRFVVLSVLLSVASNLLLSFQSSLIVIGIIWACNGFFQSMAWTPGMNCLTQWWPRRRHGFAIGFAHAASGFGQCAATLSVAAAFLLLPNLGWKAAFIFPPLLSFAFLVAYMLFAKPYPEETGLRSFHEEDEAQRESEREMEEIVRTKGQFYPYWYLLKQGRFLIWTTIIFESGLIRYGLLTWIPLFFMERFGMEASSGLLQSLALPAGMGFGTLFISSLTDRFCPGNRLPAIIFSGLASAFAVGIFSMLDPTRHFLFMQILLFTAGFFVYAINGICCVYAADMGGRVLSGTTSGILNFSGYAGAAFQSVVYGWLLDSMGWDILFQSMIFFSVLIALLAYVGTKKFK